VKRYLDQLENADQQGEVISGRCRARHHHGEANDQRSRLPMAEGGETLPGRPGTLNVVAGASYSNGEQAQP
jgi:hypothetical protein